MGAFISMNNLAGKIYMMIDGRRGIGDIVKEVVNLYKDIPIDKVKVDVCKCVSDLESFNLITVVR